MNELTVSRADKSYTSGRSRRLYPVPAIDHASARPVSNVSWARAYRARLRITDTAIIFAALALGYFTRLLIDPTLLAIGPSQLRFALGSVGLAVLWLITLAAFRSHDLKTVGVGIDEYKRVLAASITLFGILAIVLIVGGVTSARWFYLSAAPSGVVGLLLGHWLWRKWLYRQRAHGRFFSRVVVVGKRQDVAKVVKQIAVNAHAAYSVVGVVLDEIHDNEEDGPFSGIPVHQGLDQAVSFASTVGSDGIVVAGQPSSEGDYIRDLAWELEGKSLELILATSLTNVAGPRIHFRPVDGLPLLHVEIPKFDGGKHVLKRAMDVVISGTALLVLAPFLLLVSVMVRADSSGPSLFSQDRVGRDGRTFRIFKFRSMSQDAPQRLAELRAANEGSGVLFKMKNDPRVTRLGAVLRKYSIDELPQLWNVLIGDMSLVGPRPPLPDEVQEYEDHVHRRLYIKPGLTGMWQVNGRSSLSWEDSVRLDLYYVENWSVLGDLIIMWRTVRVLIEPVGAY